MSEAFFNTEQMSAVGRYLVPYAFLILFSLLTLSLFVLPMQTVEPFLVLSCVYYWAVNKPGLFPPLVIFTVGLTIDLLSGGPVGLNAFTLLIVQFVTQEQHRFLRSQSFLVVWAVYALTVLICAALHWSVFSLSSWQVLDPVPQIIGTGVSIVLFPLFVRLFLLSEKFGNRGGKNSV